jgi:hypothetical protein
MLSACTTCGMGSAVKFVMPTIIIIITRFLIMNDLNLGSLGLQNIYIFGDSLSNP